MLTIKGRMGTFLRCGLGDLEGLLSLLGPFIERHAGALCIDRATPLAPAIETKRAGMGHPPQVRPEP